MWLVPEEVSLSWKTFGDGGIGSSIHGKKTRKVEENKHRKPYASRL